MQEASGDHFPTSDPFELRLLRDFSLRGCDGIIDVTPAAERVLAMVALNGGSCHRLRIAGTLWPDGTDDRALANLRSTIWRMPERVRSGVVRHGMTVSLAGDWSVDVDACRDLVERITETPGTPGDRSLLSMDLLPYWDQPWLDALREQHRQLRLHALEVLANAQLAAGDTLEAIDTVMTVIADAPLRESAQLLLLRAHLETGNRQAVLSEFDRFAALLHSELGVEPSVAMVDIASTARGDRACSAAMFAADASPRRPRSQHREPHLAGESARP